MNERIQKLLKVAIEDIPRGYNPGTGYYVPGEFFEKFAELIVRECCDWIDGSPSTDAGQLLLTKSFIIANIKGHFGVEL